MSHSPKLFTPTKVGAHILQHRVVLSPLTRMRATKEDHVPVNPMMKTYYSQRSSRPGTLLITEGTFITPQAGGYDYVPGIWSEAQITAWKEIVDAVHANGSFIFLQIAGLGRSGGAALKRDGYPLVAPSPIPLDPNAPASDIPRELTISEIDEYIQWFTQAAKNAVDGAGFDGVEVHCANGYLLNQFLDDNANQRTDAYGGSVENRSRFVLEVVDAIAKAVGEDKIGVKISPWSTFQNMRMKDPIPQYAYFAHSLRASHPDLAYLHALEPDRHSRTPTDSNDFLRAIWTPKPFISAGEYIRETALDAAERNGDLIAFGKLFISNPDLPTRLEKNLSLVQPDTTTYYTQTEEGYTTYSFAPSSV